MVCRPSPELDGVGTNPIPPSLRVRAKHPSCHVGVTHRICELYPSHQKRHEVVLGHVATLKKVSHYHSNKISGNTHGDSTFGIMQRPKQMSMGWCWGHGRDHTLHSTPSHRVVLEHSHPILYPYLYDLTKNHCFIILSFIF
ncbi:hypothetical protein HanRHA438_Chr01g0045731 [Helianthus annuus]|nr:hypothetical protein HanRHA438_Chr01g0045731 [Helianthus annuus]